MTDREALESIARAVWRESEEDDDDFCHDRETLLGILYDVRSVLHEKGISYYGDDALHTAAHPQELCICECHGKPMCMNIDPKKGVGCARLANHGGDHVNGFVSHSWPRR